MKFRPALRIKRIDVAITIVQLILTCACLYFRDLELFTCWTLGVVAAIFLPPLLFRFLPETACTKDETTSAAYRTHNVVYIDRRSIAANASSGYSYLLGLADKFQVIGLRLRAQNFKGDLLSSVDTVVSNVIYLVSRAMVYTEISTDGALQSELEVYVDSVELNLEDLLATVMDDVNSNTLTDAAMLSYFSQKDFFRMAAEDISELCEGLDNVVKKTLDMLLILDGRIAHEIAENED